MARKQERELLDLMTKFNCPCCGEEIFLDLNCEKYRDDLKIKKSKAETIDEARKKKSNKKHGAVEPYDEDRDYVACPVLAIGLISVLGTVRGARKKKKDATSQNRQDMVH